MNVTSIFVFAEIAVFHSIQIRTSLGKIVRKIIRLKVWHLTYVLWYLSTYITYPKILAHMIMYGDFMEIVETSTSYISLKTSYGIIQIRFDSLPTVSFHQFTSCPPPPPHPPSAILLVNTNNLCKLCIIYILSCS